MKPVVELYDLYPYGIMPYLVTVDNNINFNITRRLNG